MTEAISFRRLTPEDRMPAYRMFRRSVLDYVSQIGLVDPDYEEDVDKVWERQGGMAVHTETTAAEDWVARRGDHVVGWARSIERSGHLQLTHFFVHPDAQGHGVGRALLERAFPLGRGEQRSILATQNPLALGLYLRFGVEFRGSSFDFMGVPRRTDSQTGVQLTPAPVTEDVVGLDSEVLGFQRRVDLEFLEKERGLFRIEREGKLAGYCFGFSASYTGPVAVRKAEHLPDVLELLAGKAADAGLETFRFTIPALAHHAVRWALDNAYRIDPFYEVLLTSHPGMHLDRYVMTQPSFIW